MLIKVSNFLIIILLLSGLIKFLSIFIGINLNYFFMPVSLLFSLLVIFLGRQLNFDNVSILFFIFFSIVAMIFLINNIIYDNGYTWLQIFLALLLQSLIPLILILIANSTRLNPQSNPLLSIIKIMLKLNLISFVFYLIAVKIDYQSVLSFYSELVSKGIVTNPFQTSLEGVSLRFSGIFNSGFLLATFCCLSLLYYYFNDNHGRLKFSFIYISLFLMVLSTYNRNGIITYIIGTLFIFIHRYLFKFYSKAIAFSFYAIFTILSLTPVVLTVYKNHILASINTYSDQSALTKVSTFFSRIDAWVSVLNVDSTNKFLFGTGLVQGLGDANDNFYVDNGYLYIFTQGGIVLFIIFFFSWGALFSSLIRGLRYCVNDLNLRNEISMSLLLMILSMIIAMLNNLFFEPVFLTLVFMKCLLVNKRINLYYAK